MLSRECSGITPMAFCDALSSLNMAEDISSSPEFAYTFGMLEDNIKTALSKLALTTEEQYEYLIKIRQHFNGYRFHPRQQDAVYNPQACFHYLMRLIQTRNAPNPVFDTNIGVSSDYLTYSNEVESQLLCSNLEWKRILLEGLSRGSNDARRIVNDILKAEISDKTTRIKLLSDFADLVKNTAPHIVGKLI